MSVGMHSALLRGSPSIDPSNVAVRQGAECRRHNLIVPPDRNMHKSWHSVHHYTCISHESHLLAWIGVASTKAWQDISRRCQDLGEVVSPGAITPDIEVVLKLLLAAAASQALLCQVTLCIIPHQHPPQALFQCTRYSVQHLCNLCELQACWSSLLPFFQPSLQWLMLIPQWP